MARYTGCRIERSRETAEPREAGSSDREGDWWQLQRGAESARAERRAPRACMCVEGLENYVQGKQCQKRQKDSDRLSLRVHAWISRN